MADPARPPLAPTTGFRFPSAFTILFGLIVIIAGLTRVTRLKGREIWMIPILMWLFALGGTTEGMAEETLAFYVQLTPVMIAAGYDARTAVAIILLGAGVGVLGSTANAFSTVIASDAAGVPFI